MMGISTELSQNTDPNENNFIIINAERRASAEIKRP